MKVVIDSAIPYIKGLIEPYADTVCYLPGSSFTPEQVQDADALIIRTRTKCNAALLDSSKVSFIASATIGTDHVDLEYLKDRKIHFSNAPGCNAGGVMQYVLTTLYTVAQKKDISLKDKIMGVIGVGNTGSRVADLAEYLGFRVLRNDPPKAQLVQGDFHSLEEVLEKSDIITCHLPLDDTTRSLVDRSFLSRMKPGAVFINASRGEVVVDEALMEAAESRLSALILDVWNGEPHHINSKLMSLCDIATPHIAGYSLEGKINGTVAVLRAFGSYFDLPELRDYHFRYEKPTPILQLKGLSETEICQKLYQIFPVLELDTQLRAAAGDFEKIRSSYALRNEFIYR